MKAFEQRRRFAMYNYFNRLRNLLYLSALQLLAAPVPAILAAESTTMDETRRSIAKNVAIAEEAAVLAKGDADVARDETYSICAKTAKFAGEPIFDIPIYGPSATKANDAYSKVERIQSEAEYARQI